MWFLFLMWLKITASEQEKACRRACGHMRAFFCARKNALMLQNNITVFIPSCRGLFPLTAKRPLHFFCTSMGARRYRAECSGHSIKILGPTASVVCRRANIVLITVPARRGGAAWTQRQANSSAKGIADTQKGLCVCRGLPSVIFYTVRSVFT